MSFKIHENFKKESINNSQFNNGIKIAICVQHEHCVDAAGIKYNES